MAAFSAAAGAVLSRVAVAGGKTAVPVRGGDKRPVAVAGSFRPVPHELLGDVVVLGAPVAEGEQAVPDSPLARGGPGDAGTQVQHVAEFSLPIQATAIS